MSTRIAPTGPRSAGQLQPAAEQAASAAGRRSRTGRATTNTSTYPGIASGSTSAQSSHAPAGEVVERDEHGEAAADESVPTPTPTPSRTLLAERRGQQGAGDRVEGVADRRSSRAARPAARRRPSATSTPSTAQPGHPGRRAVGVGAGLGGVVSSTRPRASSRPPGRAAVRPRSTVDRVDLHVRPARDVLGRRRRRGWRRTRCPRRSPPARAAR